MVALRVASGMIRDANLRDADENLYKIIVPDYESRSARATLPVNNGSKLGRILAGSSSSAAGTRLVYTSNNTIALTTHLRAWRRAVAAPCRD